MYPIKLLKRFRDHTNQDSLASRLRRKRFILFEQLYDLLEDRQIRVLDLGGTESFWSSMGFLSRRNIDITILNIEEQQVSHASVKSVVGDGRCMREYKDEEFDVVFSNSVIEHVGTLEAQMQMASEIRRVGRRYFVQTPNRYFPMEPHFLFPFFQFLPLSLATWLVIHLKLGWYGLCDPQHAREAVESIRLLTEKEMKMLFPAAVIYREKFWGLTKSLVAYGGW